MVCVYRELFVLTRDKIELSLKDDSMDLKSLKGRLFMTSMRMVFMPRDPAKARNIESFEMPFRGLWDEKFNQPIFSVNNLTATVQYYDQEPFSGRLLVKLGFPEGGVNTFLPMFNNVLRAIRIQLAQEARAAAAVGSGPPPPIPAQSAAGPASPTEFMPGQNSAFVDPHDPSRIYTTQPVVIDDQRRANMPAWHADAPEQPGLRRRA
jgi:WW domain-binding protein 2